MLVILYGQTGAGKDYIARKLLGSLGVDARQSVLQNL